jgi:hypothetical protein
VGNWWNMGPVGDFFHKHKTSRRSTAAKIDVTPQSLGAFMRGFDYRLGAAKREKLLEHLTECSGQRWTLAKLNAARRRLAAVHPIRSATEAA